MREMEDFSQSEFDEIYNGLKCCAIKEAYAVDFPKAIILGGQTKKLMFLLYSD